MSIHSSSFLDSGMFSIPPDNSSSVSLYTAFQTSRGTKLIHTTYVVINTFLLFPLYIFALHVGVQQWRRQRSAPAAMATSHSDFFTYHMIVLEIICGSGSVFYTLGIYIRNEILLMFGVFLFNSTLLGQTLFHILTCVERYLAAVHPVTYMRLRETFGLRIRTITTVCVWLLCFGGVSMAEIFMPELFTKIFFFFMAVSVFVVFFCCLSVLYVLIRPGPGEVGGNKERVDQSKQRAFHMILAITGALLLRFLGLLLWFGLLDVTSLDPKTLCAVIDSGILLMVPSSLILPLLFLHRAGKLSCCRKTAGTQ